MATTAKTQSTQRRARWRAKGFKLPSDVRAFVREVDGFIEISPERIDMLVSAGAIPAADLEKLKFHALQLIADLLDFQREMSVQRTHRRLVRDLAELRGIARSGVVPAVPPSPRIEIVSLAVRVRLNLPYGPHAPIPLEEARGRMGAMVDTRVEATRALLGAPALASLLDSVIKFVDRAGPTTPQHFASKGSFRLEDEVIYAWLEYCWHGVLGRRLITSPELSDFAIAVFKFCGVPVPTSLERRLQYLVRGAAGSAG